MSRFGDVLKNVIIGHRKPEEMYNRIFIVSAYGGITNLLLENKKNGTPGVYGKFANADSKWEDALNAVSTEMKRINRTFIDLGLDIQEADAFVDERIGGIREYLCDLYKVWGFGSHEQKAYLHDVREMLSAIGEAQSAFNSVKILQKHGINAVLMDLTGWKQRELPTFNDAIKQAFQGLT